MFFLAGILLVVGLIYMKKDRNLKKVLYFSTASKPFSSDPMDYDYYVHHYAFTSVLAKLISIERKGVISPILAEKWTHDSTFKDWTFNIRQGLFYSNGDKILAKDIAKSLIRVAYLKKKTNSNSGVLEFVEGFDLLKSASDNITGISYTDNKLFLKFNKPMPDLLSKISFGFYSLAHPSLYNPTSGEWIDKKKVISSGAYDIDEWSDTKFNLKLRENIPYVNYENSIQNVSFTSLLSVKESKDLKDVDVVVADKQSLLIDDSFAFSGSTVGLKIGYVHLYGWNKNKSLKDINIRRWLRSKFYEGLEVNGFTPTSSFFPTTLRDVKEIPKEVFLNRPDFNDFKLVTHSMDQSMKLNENKDKKSMSEIFGLALDNLNGDGIILKKKIIDDESDLSDFDLVINGTGIESSDYWDTVKFMFLSKNGILLPDESGAILNELSSKKPDINFINKELWDQAIIWPVRHYTNGFWFKRDSLINFENINLDSPAIDFQFFSWN